VIPCCPNTSYSYVEYTLYLRRRYTFYVISSSYMFYAIIVVVVHVLRDERDRSVHSALGARHGRVLSAAGRPI